MAYSDEGSRVLVTTRTRGRHRQISVVDQGIGIPAREIDRIFERFYRVDPARHRSTGGTGLGLSIVKHVAATHGGDVSVWSVEGQGSTFTLTLPRSVRTRLAGRPRRRRPVDASGDPRHPDPTPTDTLTDHAGGTPVTRVLVVEDEESYSDALAYMLRKEGYEVAIAADGTPR